MRALLAGLALALCSCTSLIGVHDPTLLPDTLALDSITAPSGTVNTVLGTPVAVTLTDANGDGVEGATIHFAVSAGGGHLSTATAMTDASGHAHSTLTLGTMAGTNSVSVTSDDVPDASLTFTATGLAGPVDAAHSSVATDATTPVADGVMTATITVTVHDIFDNPVADQAVTLSATGTAPTLVQPAPTDATGTTTGTISASAIGTKTISATAGGVTLTQQPTVLFIAGPPSATQSSVTATATPVVANSVATATITVTVRDANHDLLPGQTVTLQVSGTSNMLGAIAVTDANGVTTVTLASTLAEAKTITASVGSVTIAQQPVAMFIAGPASAAETLVVANPVANVVADGSAISTITVTVRDAFDNPIAAAPVTLSASGSNNTLSAPAATNSAGVTTATLKSTKAESKTITAKSGATTFTAAPTVAFVAGAAVKIQLVTGSPQSGTAGEALPNPFVAEVSDAKDNPVAGVSVQFVVTAGGGTMSASPVSTDPAGLASSTLTLGPGAGPNTVEARVTGLTPVVFSATNASFVVSFAAHVDFATGLGPSGIAVGDLNGDGKPDVVTSNEANSGTTVSVRLNTTATGATTPTFSAKFDFTTGANPKGIAIGDLNGDGLPDLAVANISSNTVSILLSTTAIGATTPSFSTKVDFATGASPEGLTLADINGGKPDLVIANVGSDTVSVLLNTTATGAAIPTFAGKVDFATASFPVAVAAGDLNADGLADLAIADENGNAVTILLSTTASGATTPTFAARVDFSAGAGCNAIAIGDINADGKPDVVAANALAASVSVFLNTTATNATTPTFAAKVDLTVGSHPQSLAVDDLNGDGKADIVTGNFSDDTLSVLLDTTPANATTPTFTAKVDLSTGAGSSPGAVAVCDVNGDGKADLVSAGTNSSKVSVLLAQ